MTASGRGNSWMNRSQWFSLYVTLCAMCLFVLAFAAGASKPLHLDDVDFALAAQRTAHSGLPLYYGGEQNPQASALYHPPLYIYTLAVWMRLFGGAETQIRLFGMICAIVQGVIVLALIRTVFGGAVMWRWMAWFWIAFLLNPYTIQSASIADIDSTIYGPLLCAALLAVLRLSWRDGVWRTDTIRLYEYGLVSAAVCCCLWAKLTTVILAFPFIFLLLIARMGARRAVYVTACMAGAGVAGFLATYWLYGQVLGLDIRYSFRFLWMSFTQRGSSGASGLVAGLRDRFANFRGMVPFMFRWIGLIPWMCAAVSLALAGVAAIRERDRQSLHYGLVLFLAFLSTLYYCAQVFTFGYAPFKYVFVYWGLIVTALFYVVDRGFASKDAIHWKPVAVIFVLLYGAAFLWAMAVVHDSIIYNGVAAAHWRLAVFLPALVFVVGFPWIRRPAGKSLVIASLALYCGLQTGVAISQSRARYSTTYDYGQWGFEDTAAFLRLNTTPDDLILSMKDIGYATGRRYFSNYSALYGSEADLDRAIEVIQSGRVKFSVFTERRGQDQLIMRPRLQEWIRHHCKVVFVHGDYRVYQFASDRPDPVPPSPTARSSR
jgi:hypothetical protein